MSVQAVLFDLDNTLTHRDLSVQAYSQFLLNEFRSDLISSDQIELNQTIEIIRRIDNGGYPEKEYLTHPSIAASVAHALIDALPWHNPPQLEKLTEFWFEQFGLSAVAMQGAEALLHQLKQQNYKLAVISNGGHATRLKILEGLGFLDYFDEVFSSESVGISKPKAEIFLHSCQKIQVDPQQSLYIGDHPINDYAGATLAGLRALLLEGFHSTDLLEKIDLVKPIDSRQPIDSLQPKQQYDSSIQPKTIQHLHEVMEFLD